MKARKPRLLFVVLVGVWLTGAIVSRVISAQVIDLNGNLLPAWPLTGGPIEGQVLDYDTEKPIAGAIVVAGWTGNLASGFDPPKSG